MEPAWMVRQTEKSSAPNCSGNYATCRRMRNALWQRLRARQLDNAKFRRQHPFDDYILDFACLERTIVIELDGGQHADAADYDAKRTATLEKAGFVVLRFWNNEVFENMDGVLEVIWTTLRARAKPSPPNPPLEGEG
ncbi:endonuclease domain-containing protein [Luteimonas sp. SX5]|uniref:Endonuclease domain-containing protein n=1 Tax=Luteimonas galliterrae TaxID=2940486 RepID=A0ABT0MG90_9GAMM|nr:endonuclease domain-containing protein [Luteimonas galliterrae]MCL1633877.1 endonuclease domain-containing protein [Luteimonas galliterrae]